MAQLNGEVAPKLDLINYPLSLDANYKHPKKQGIFPSRLNLTLFVRTILPWLTN